MVSGKDSFAAEDTEGTGESLREAKWINTSNVFYSIVVFSVCRQEKRLYKRAYKKALQLSKKLRSKSK